MKLNVVSLGCDKNLVDTEYMIGLASKAGYEFVDDENEADVMVINTCCFIHDAKQESINAILEAATLKSFNLKALIVCGCLAQRYAKEIREEIPEVDAVVGTSSYDEVIDAIDEVLKGLKPDHVTTPNRFPMPDCRRVLSTAGHYAYLKIAEGCNKCCTYCIIPKIRGNYRSYPMERLIDEARQLAEQGVRELIVIAQETTVYGVDIYGRKALPELLCKLSEIEGIEWIRLMYAYPEEITDELIEVMSTNPKILHYIDMPLQHASDAVLKRMGRRTNQADIRNIIAKLRASIPDICLRTTMISGFPGETEADHEELYRFINEIEFDRLGVFTYSAEEGTPAVEFADQVDEDTKNYRRNELMELQQAVTFDFNEEEMIGKKLRVIVEGEIPEDEAYVCRTYRDAPDVDGFLFLKKDRNLMTGDMVDVVVSNADGYDLKGDEVR